MLTRIATVALVLVALTAGTVLLNQSAPTADAHCQVPCGIFDDSAELKKMYEHAATIEKSMREMAKVAGAHDAQSHQQFVRWTMNKEAHAEKVIRSVSDYFLAQKLKPVAPDARGYDPYLGKLAAHHAVMVAAMKCKQSTSLAQVEKLKSAIHTLEHIWDPNHKD